jgi:flagellar basal-body rod modification protein FlgD
MQVGTISDLATLRGEASRTAAPKDEFLRLLVAQLQHQDPLSPQDGSAFVAQLAQFASLEQIAETNSRLGSIEAGQAASVRSGFTNLVGKKVSSRSDAIMIPDSQVEHVVHLGSAATKVDVVIHDSSGREVRRIAMGSRGEGDAAFTWDGRSNDGTTLPDGEYRVSIEAAGAGDAPVDAYALIRGVVSSVDFGDDGTVTFRVGESKITPADIISIEN